MTTVSRQPPGDEIRPSHSGGEIEPSRSGGEIEPPRSGGEIEPSRPPGDRFLVWMAGVSWDGIRGTDRHLAVAMARHARILWVDPPVSPVRMSAVSGMNRRSLRPTLSVIDDRVTRLTPVALPGFSRPAVRSTTEPLVRSQVRWALRRLDIRPFAVVATHTDAYLGYWGPDVVDVLYGTDDYVAGAELLGQSARRLRGKERRALARADVVAAVSPQLADRWAGLGARPEVIPNGCWPAGLGGQAPPAGLADLPRPVAGLIGQLSGRIDLDVLEAIERAGLSLLLVGPLDPRWEQRRFAELIARSQVHYAGPVSAGAVPSYLAAVDVGITPYRDTPFNRASFPLKTLEYLGAGVPVVSADLPAARWLRADLEAGEQAGQADQILALARGQADFADAIRRIAASACYATPGGRDPSGRDPAGRDPSGRDRHRLVAERCRAFAARHTWSRRADAFAAAIGLL